MTHHIMSLFGAATGTYYPDPEASASTYYGASTTSGDSTFESANTAVIRAMLISASTAGAPVIKLFDASGNSVDEWTTSTTLAQSLLCGPDGFKISGGFSIDVSSASGASITVIYDKR